MHISSPAFSCPSTRLKSTVHQLEFPLIRFIDFNYFNKPLHSNNQNARQAPSHRLPGRRGLRRPFQPHREPGRGRGHARQALHQLEGQEGRVRQGLGRQLL